MNNVESADRKREQAENKKTSDIGLKVRVTLPDNVPDVIRREKINRIYDILTGNSDD